MLDEKTPEMTGSDSQAIREAFHPAIVQATLRDKSQSSRHGGRSSQPRRRSRGCFRAAAQARAKACVRRSSRCRKVADVLLLRRRGRANRAAIDSAAQHSDEELAVETWIAR